MAISHKLRGIFGIYDRWFFIMVYGWYLIEETQ